MIDVLASSPLLTLFLVVATGAVLGAIPFGRMALNSLQVAVIATAGSLLVSVLAAYAFSRLTFRGRDGIFLVLLSALMIPDVTVPARPSGEPTATTGSPTWRLLLRPSVATGRPVARIFTTARSVSGSVPTSVASASVPSASRTSISSASPTTWSFVTM